MKIQNIAKVDDETSTFDQRRIRGTVFHLSRARLIGGPTLVQSSWETRVRPSWSSDLPISVRAGLLGCSGLDSERATGDCCLASRGMRASAGDLYELDKLVGG